MKRLISSVVCLAIALAFLLLSPANATLPNLTDEAAPSLVQQEPARLVQSWGHVDDVQFGVQFGFYVEYELSSEAFKGNWPDTFHVTLPASVAKDWKIDDVVYVTTDNENERKTERAAITENASAENSHVAKFSLEKIGTDTGEKSRVIRAVYRQRQRDEFKEGEQPPMSAVRLAALKEPSKAY